MTQGHQSQSPSLKNGFTIVELLIVIVVIGILAAITIVSFNGVQAKAYDSVVKSDLATISKKLQNYAAEKGKFPNSVAEITDAGLKVSSNAYKISPSVSVNVGFCTKGNGSGGFAVFAMSKSGKRYVVTESNNVTEDATGTTWDASTSTVGTQCGALGYSAPFTHGYFSGDASNPWRVWIGTN